MQIDNFMELPAKKRPSSKLIWEGTQEELSEWLDNVMNPNKKERPEIMEFVIPEAEIEG